MLLSKLLEYVTASVRVYGDMEVYGEMKEHRKCRDCKIIREYEHEGWLTGSFVGTVKNEGRKQEKVFCLSFNDWRDGEKPKVNKRAKRGKDIE